MREPPRETPFGTLYPPQPLGWQLLLLAGAFFASLLCGWIPRLIMADVSATAGTLLHIPFVLVFVLGYAGWAARLQAMSMELLGRSLLRALWQWLLFRRKPDVKQLLPDENKLLQLLVRGQKAASSFWLVALGLALISGGLALFIQSPVNFLVRVIAITGPVLLWGWVLTRLGRRGYLPFPESAD
jgi:hypothetical protein